MAVSPLKIKNRIDRESFISLKERDREPEREKERVGVIKGF